MYYFSVTFCLLPALLLCFKTNEAWGQTRKRETASSLYNAPRAPASSEDSPEQSTLNTGKSSDGDPCETRTWKLDNADANHRTEDVTFSNDWIPSLNEVNDCVTGDLRDKACVRIRGHFDVRTFSPEVIAAFGSMEAAQMSRARSRSIMVSAKLYEMGISAAKLQIVPPSRKPSFRGVSIEIVENCLQGAPPVPAWAESPDAFWETLGRKKPRETEANVALEQKTKGSMTSENGVWLGARAGVMIPLGSLYHTKRSSLGSEEVENVTSIGPSFEINGGFRFHRSFVVFAYWEYAWLGSGAKETWQKYGGGQKKQVAYFLGLGGRATLDVGPGMGLNLELGAAIHWLELAFKNGTEIKMISPVEARIGLGAHYRFNRMFSLETLFLVSGGVYARRQIDYPTGHPIDMDGQNRFHSYLGLVVCGNFDVNPFVKRN